VSIRKIVASAGVGVVLVLGGAAVPAAAAPSPASASQSDVTAFGWEDTGERFSGPGSCDIRGEWYYDNHWNAWDWECRWNSTNRNYQLWVWYL
jgi:hypothetical protein